MNASSGFDEAIKGFEALSAGMDAAGDQVLSDAVESIKSQMSREGAPITYPVQWDSERQRRFVMWKLRKENNLPYRRTGKYVAAWTHERVPFGHALANRHPAGAIGGTPAGWQSRIHRGRWPFLLKVLFDELANLPTRISEALKVLSGK